MNYVDAMTFRAFTLLLMQCYHAIYISTEYGSSIPYGYSMPHCLALWWLGWIASEIVGLEERGGGK